MQYFTRVCWNDNYWQKPSGSLGKKPNLFEGEHGYGNEEWLFDIYKTIEGYHYSHLQSIQPNDRRDGAEYDLKLFSIETKNNETSYYYIGTINNITCVDADESTEVHEKYVEEGWLELMRNELLDVGVSNQSLSFLNNTQNFVSMKFRPEDLDILDVPKLIEGNQKEILQKKCKYYQVYKNQDLLNAVFGDETVIESTIGRSGFDDDTDLNTNWTMTANRKSRYVKGKEDSRTHKAWQESIYLQLKRESNDDYIVWNLNKGERELNATFSGGVDMAVEISEGCEVYYEIKTEAKGPHHCIRIAIGQLLEYAYYPPNQLIAKRLVIVSRYALDENGKQYINYIRDTLKIPIFYQQYHPEEGTLDNKPYPSNPLLNVECEML